MANPNPARITDELWRFRTACLALEPGSNDEDSGIYANKPGYHNTRAANDPDDYSVRDAPDKRGPSDKAAAWDWTFTSAQNGDYSRISIYGKRALAAWEARDPRMNVMREFLGQTDTDATPEGLDFRYHTKRTPDSTHKWHIHGSFVRAYVAIPGALEGPLSVYRGESLAAYLAAGHKLYKIDGTGELEVSAEFTKNFLEAIQDPDVAFLMRALPWQYVGGGLPSGASSSLMALNQATTAAKAAQANTNGLSAKVDELASAMGLGFKSLSDKIDALAAGGVPPADLSDLKATLQQIEDGVNSLVSATKAAGAAVLG